MIIGLACAALAGCGTPDFAGVAPVAVRVNGLDLDVYRAGGAVRVDNVGRAYRSEGDFVYTAVRVAERVTGCRIRRNTLHGGPARITGRLEC